MKTLFTSDTHFNHKNILKYCSSRDKYADVHSMNLVFIENWNSVVDHDDNVFHLGDVLFGNSFDILDKLNGKIHLIIGNHDHRNLRKDSFRQRFATINSYIELEKNSIVMMHYPIESWNGMRRGMIHLHGHCHGTLEHKIKNRMDVGIDCHPQHRPFTLEEIHGVLATQEGSNF